MLKLQTVQARERDLLWIIDQKYLNETTTYYDDPMDLIDGYPKPEIAYIGFFMMNPTYQGKKIGTAIIGEVVEYMRDTGKTAVRLAIDKGNPQSTHFWTKNGFRVIFEADVNGWTKLVAERQFM